MLHSESTQKQMSARTTARGEMKLLGVRHQRL